jgi:restriction endonuclease S subunit
LKTLIKDITIIQTGLFAKPQGNGDLVYLQARHFDENGMLNNALYTDLSSNGIAEKHILRHGDVLFAAKGTKNFATIYEGHNPPAVASTSFFVIRFTENNIIPEYFAWFLNTYAIQTLLKGLAIGTAIPSISKQVLESLEMTIPDLKTQHAILQIVKLRNKEKSLNQKIEILKEKQIQQYILNAIK